MKEENCKLHLNFGGEKLQIAENLPERDLLALWLCSELYLHKYVIRRSSLQHKYSCNDIR